MESILNKAGEYFENRVELIRLKTFDKSSDVISTLVMQFILIACATIAVVMISTGVSLWIGYCLDRLYLGFLIVGMFYLLLGLLLYLNRKSWLKKGIQEDLVKKFLE